MPSDRPSRRRFLRTAGGAAALALAGCSGGNDGTTDQPATDAPGATGTAGPDGNAASTSRSANRNPLALPTVAPESTDGEVGLRPEGELSFVNFFATWCEPCKKEMPDLREVRAEFDADRVHMVSVTPEADEAAIRQFWETYEGTWPVAMDADLRATSRWGVSSYPTNKLFDAEGNELGYTGLRHYEDIAPAIESELDGD
ncbi:TlpA family protein disulfide reductase [Halosimplex pelagicum]|uniref:TlpA family protein disulfide reductase n=1 Tax=Halosimplex pelagicum TaxID=869886 RepID=A0A7D5TE79_9EURY|nr:TlpA disulfide reductase family protein [Halosimplex pelagicum]QLH84409.1 TlpA family protein disulfide reductase [Halosimplex pelagicum]